MATREYRVISTMLPLRDSETGKKRRYYKGDKVMLTDEQAQRYMKEDGRETSRKPSVEPVVVSKEKEKAPGEAEVTTPPAEPPAAAPASTSTKK